MNVGDPIGNYRLDKKLGAGTFGTAWLASDSTAVLDEYKQVVIKFPNQELTDKLFKAIVKEAKVWKKATGHPNVMAFIDVKKFNEHIVIISEYADGGSLGDLLKGKGGLATSLRSNGELTTVRRGIDENGEEIEHCKLSAGKAVEMITGILRGLEFLHARKIIHRDLKPDNIFLQANAPHLADFGISRDLDSTIELANSSFNLAGTPYYMAPEAFNYKRNKETDLWSVGVIFYELLTGEHPFLSREEIRQNPPKPLLTSVPPRLQKIVLKALEKDPTQRGTTAEMLKALDEAFAEASYPTVEINKNAPVALKPPAPEVKLIPYRKGDKWGFCDVNKKLMIEAKYAHVEPFSDGLALVITEFGKNYGFIDKKGNYVILKENDSASSFRNGLARFAQNGKWGFIDKTGDVVVPPKYDGVEEFSSEGVATVHIRKPPDIFIYGLIDKTGEVIIPVKYNNVSVPSEGLVSVSSKKRLDALFDTKGNQVTEFKYGSIHPFSEGVAVVLKDGKYGFINKIGREVIPLEYDRAESFSEGLATIKRNGKYGFINKSNREIIPLKYDGVRSFSEGLAMVASSGFIDKFLSTDRKHLSFIDKSGNKAISLDKDTYMSGEFTGKFSGGLAFIVKTVPDNTDLAMECIIDKRGNEITEPKYEESRPFSNGLAWVKVGGRFDTRILWGCVDKNGKEVIPLKYNVWSPGFTNGLAKVQIIRENDRHFDLYIDENGTEYFED